MGAPQITKSFKITEKTLLDIDDIKRALFPFLDTDSATTRLCIALTHTMLFEPATRSDLLRSLQMIVKINKGKTRTDEETRVIKKKYEEKTDIALSWIARQTPKRGKP